MPCACAARVGTARGSTANRLRPVGSTSLRPRCGEPAGPGATRWPDSAANQRVPLFVAAVAAAEHMQAIAELAFLEIADEAVDARDRFGRCGRRGETEIVLDTGSAGFIADRGNKALTPRRIEAVGGGIFVEQLFEPHEIRRQRRCGERRRQMADGDRADAALGLRGLAGIVDDEGIDHRHIADQRFGPALFRQRHRFAGQPFQRPVRAHMDQRMDALRP